MHIAPLREGYLLEEGEVAFEEVDEGKRISCPGLTQFSRLYHPHTGAPITIMDNHNHALYFWLEALQQKYIAMEVLLVHVDQHKDMRDPGTRLTAKELANPMDAFVFANTQVHVGSFIVPALESGLVRDVVMLDSDQSFVEVTMPKEPFILDIDIDVFAPELGYMDQDRMREVIKELFARAACVTIATSPYFIPFPEAKQWIETILADAGILR